MSTFNQLVNKYLRTNEIIRKFATYQGDDYAAGFFMIRLQYNWL